MATIYLHISPINSTNRAGLFRYRVAGNDLVSDVAIGLLRDFMAGSVEQTESILPSVSFPEEDDSLVYDDTGWIGQKWRAVQCWSGAAGYRLSISGIGSLHITNNGEQIIVTNRDPSCESSLLGEAILGPALVLALALQDMWSIHASSVEYGGRAILITGDSGYGKSTLASYLQVSTANKWRGVADDLVPLRFGPQCLLALPHFPQLKLTGDQQPGTMQPETLPVATVLILEKPLADTIRCERIGPQEKVMAIARHTVASRLFDSALLERHLDFCVQSSTQVEMFRLAYPHRRDLLHQVEQHIVDVLFAHELI